VAHQVAHFQKSGWSRSDTRSQLAMGFRRMTLLEFWMLQIRHAVTLSVRSPESSTIAVEGLEPVSENTGKSESKEVGGTHSGTLSANTLTWLLHHLQSDDSISKQDLVHILLRAVQNPD
jgi:hypothetical protein